MPAGTSAPSTLPTTPAEEDLALARVANLEERRHALLTRVRALRGDESSSCLSARKREK